MHCFLTTHIASRDLSNTRLLCEALFMAVRSFFVGIHLVSTQAVDPVYAAQVCAACACVAVGPHVRDARAVESFSAHTGSTMHVHHSQGAHPCTEVNLLRTASLCSPATFPPHAWVHACRGCVRRWSS